MQCGDLIEREGHPIQNVIPEELAMRKFAVVIPVANSFPTYRSSLASPTSVSTKLSSFCRVKVTLAS